MSKTSRKGRRIFRSYFFSLLLARLLFELFFVCSKSPLDLSLNTTNSIKRAPLCPSKSSVIELEKHFEWTDVRCIAPNELKPR